MPLSIFSRRNNIKAKHIFFLLSLLLPLASYPFFLQSNAEMDVGKWSYGTVHIHFGSEKSVKIGSFCSIATVHIMIGGDHRTDWVSTFPFPSFTAPEYWPEASKISGQARSKGNVTIGNDVWIGSDVFILSGVTVGDGAVIGAKSVVTKDIPPYAIAAGNPARVVKYRFDPDTIERLLAIAWWNWPDSEIKEVIPLLMSNQVEEFIEECECRLFFRIFH